MSEVNNNQHDWFWKLANLQSFLKSLQHKNYVLKVALFGSVFLNIALIGLVLLIA